MKDTNGHPHKPSFYEQYFPVSKSFSELPPQKIKRIKVHEQGKWDCMCLHEDKAPQAVHAKNNSAGIKTS